MQLRRGHRADGIVMLQLGWPTLDGLVVSPLFWRPRGLGMGEPRGSHHSAFSAGGSFSGELGQPCSESALVRTDVAAVTTAAVGGSAGASITLDPLLDRCLLLTVGGGAGVGGAGVVATRPMLDSAAAAAAVPGGWLAPNSELDTIIFIPSRTPHFGLGSPTRPPPKHFYGERNTKLSARATFLLQCSCART